VTGVIFNSQGGFTVDLDGAVRSCAQQRGHQADPRRDPAHERAAAVQI